jgi:dTDP-4-amino-4,6-dideoxygalactose transaminase
LTEGGPQLVGGVFGLEPIAPRDETRSLPVETEETILLVNGRSAIALVVDLVRPLTVWLPSYLCDALVAAVSAAPSVEFYEVGSDLRMPSADWVRRLQQGDLVVVVDYFGFPFEFSAAGDVRDRGAIILRDACQALLSTADRVRADYDVYSPRKFLGVPDGGILTCRTPLDGAKPILDEAPVEWWLDGLEAGVLRRAFDRHGGTREWFDRFRRYEAHAPVGRFRMSEVSSTLLAGANYAEIASRRTRNYRVLLDALGDIALLPRLPDGVVPLGFPVRVANRDALRDALFANDIYPAVHWPVPSSVPARFSESRELAATILTLPCDQRYEPETMQRIAQLVSAAQE